MSRREYNNPQLPPSTGPSPIHYFPFTQNATDVVGDWGTLNGSCSGFSEEGAFFDNNSIGFSKVVNAPNTEFTVIDFEFKVPAVYTSGVYALLRVLFNNDANINFYIAPDWGQELNASVYSKKNTYAALSLPTIPIIANTYHRITLRQNISSNSCDLFVDGVLRNSGNLCISADNIMQTMYIGRIENANTRKFKGHLRNLRFYDIELTNEQIAQL